MGKLITIIEAARQLGLTEQTMRNWMKEGHIQARSVGRSRYIDQDTVDALQDTVEDIERTKKAIGRIRAEASYEYETLRAEREDKKAYRRYMNIMVGAAIRSRFYETMVRLMYSYGLLDDRQKTILVDYLKGESMDNVSFKYGITRERVRQVIEKAIRKSADLTEIEGRLDEMRQVKADLDMLQKANESLKEQLRRFVAVEPMTDKEQAEHDELCRLLSTKITDCDLSTRALSCLKAGRVERKFSFGKIENKVVVPECRTIGDLCKLEKTDFLKIRNAGKKTLLEIDAFLQSKGLTWGMDVDKVYQERYCLTDKEKSNEKE